MNYEEYYSPEDQVKLRNHDLDMSVLEFAYPYKKILDVGAGAGVLASKLKNLGHDVTCIDVKRDYIKYLTRMGLKAILGDVRLGLPFKDKEFDLAICQEVLEHIENPGTGLQELCRVAKNVIFTLPKLHPDPWHLWDIQWKDHAGCITIKMMERQNAEHE